MRTRLLFLLFLLAALVVLSAAQPQAATPAAFSLAQVQDGGDIEKAEEPGPIAWPNAPPPLPESTAKGLRPLMVIEQLREVPLPSPEEQLREGNAYIRTRWAKLNHKVVFGPGFFAVTKTGDYAGGRVVPLRDGRHVWVARFTIKDDAPLTVSLGSLHLPPGSSIWTYVQGESHTYPDQYTVAGDEPAEFMPGMGVIYGPIVDFQVAFPAGAKVDMRKPWSVTFDDVSADLSQLQQEKASPPSGCFIDAACVGDDRFKGIRKFRTGVGYLKVGMAGELTKHCTASLIKTKKPQRYAYALTANHCVTGYKEASIEWDSVNASCNGEVPPGRRPKSRVKRVLTRSNTNDFALLQLQDAPQGRHYFDYTGDSMTYQAHCGYADCKVRTLSFPFFLENRLSMRYSEYTACFNCIGTCPSRPTFTEINDGYVAYYGLPIAAGGDLASGSSGGLVLTPEGLINGHVALLCKKDGSEPLLPCFSERNQVVVGNFLETFRIIRFYPGFF